MKVLIIGGGLSGICLGHTFMNENVSFKIIDSGKNESSRIAAGMLNPMVFRKMVKTWRGDDLIPFVKHFYPAIEKKIGARFFYPRKIRRVFSTPDEKKYWIQRLEEGGYEDYISPLSESEPTPEYIKDKFGSGWVNSPGYIDAKTFVAENQRFLEQKDYLIFEGFDFRLFDPALLTYKGEQFSHVIFAEGYKGAENPYFGYLPFAPTKGEVLSLSIEGIKTDEIINRKCFVLPVYDGTFKLGATFEWKAKDVRPTTKAKEQLLDNYTQLISKDAVILEQEAGIRPTTTDRRPLIGRHPEYENLFIFNGMGTKGYMIAPYFSKEFFDYLQGEKELDREVDIQRFYKKHFKKEKEN